MRIARIDGRSLEPRLRDGSFALFRRRRQIERGDIIAARHPKLGVIVRKVATITLRGRISLHGMSHRSEGGEGGASVARDEVLGTLMFKIPLLRWRTKRPDASYDIGDEIPAE